MSEKPAALPQSVLDLITKNWTPCPGPSTSAVPARERVEVPASATAPGEPGQVAYDATHSYVCVAKNTWKRAELGPAPEVL